MTIEQTPILRDADAEKNTYRGFAMAQMRILKDYMKVSGLNSYSRVVTLANGVVITCQKSFNREDIFISVPTGDYTEVITKEVMLPLFICTPRIFGVNDGYRRVDGRLTAVGDGSSLYPMVDSDNTSATVGYGPFVVDLSFEDAPTKTADSQLKLYRDVQLYGNVDWKGKNTSKDGTASNAPVLTWKGPTGRSVPFDYYEPIEGFTTADIQFDLAGREYYTCFGPSVYQNGKILATIPKPGDVQPKVVGCAFTEHTEDDATRLLLVCMVNNHYENETGFFSELWVLFGGEDDAATGLENGWRIIHSEPAGRPTQCWFFNESGTKCTMGNRELAIDISERSVTEIVHDAGSGIFSADVRGGGSDSNYEPPDPSNSGGLGGVKVDTSESAITIEHHGNYSIYSDYKGDVRVTASVAVVDTTARKITRVNAETYDDIEIWYEGIVPPLSISGPELYTPEAVYTVVGGAPGISYDVTSPTKLCGSDEVRVTDSCGRTAAVQVRMAEGVWHTLSVETATFYGSVGCTYPPCAPCETTPPKVIYLGDSSTCGRYNAVQCVETEAQDGTVVLTCVATSQETVSSLGTCSCNNYPYKGNVSQKLTRFWACPGEYSLVGSVETNAGQPGMRVDYIYEVN